MTGIEIVVGYLFAWTVRKATRVAGRADAEIDRTLDTAMDRLHDVVDRKLGQDPALRTLAEEAEAGQDKPNDRTRQRVELALEDAADSDPGFAAALEHALEELQTLPQTGGGVSASDSGTAIGGNVHIRADRGSAAALNMGNVTVGNPPRPGPPQG